MENFHVSAKDLERKNLNRNLSRSKVNHTIITLTLYANSVSFCETALKDSSIMKKIASENQNDKNLFIYHVIILVGKGLHAA